MPEKTNTILSLQRKLKQEKEKYDNACSIFQQDLRKTSELCQSYVNHMEYNDETTLINKAKKIISSAEKCIRLRQILDDYKKQYNEQVQKIKQESGLPFQKLQKLQESRNR